MNIHKLIICALVISTSQYTRTMDTAITTTVLTHICTGIMGYLIKDVLDDKPIYKTYEQYTDYDIKQNSDQLKSRCISLIKKLSQDSLTRDLNIDNDTILEQHITQIQGMNFEDQIQKTTQEEIITTYNSYKDYEDQTKRKRQCVKSCRSSSEQLLMISKISFVTTVVLAGSTLFI